MPKPIEDYDGRVEATADAEGRLATNPEIQAWKVVPVESEGLRPRPHEPLAPAQAPRHGQGGESCSACNHGHEPNSVDGEVWCDDHWRISVTEPSGAPLLLMLSPNAHDDFTTLPMERAAELGQIVVALGAAIEGLPSVARAVVQDLIRSYGGRALGPAA